MSRNMTLTFTVDGTTYDISSYGGVLVDSAMTPQQPIYKYVEIPGRRLPLDISLAATGQMQFEPKRYTYKVAFLGYDALLENDMSARSFEDAINGKVAEITGFDYTLASSARVSVTSHERVGEYVIVTIEAVALE